MADVGAHGVVGDVMAQVRKAMIMTLENLEQRVHELERQVAALRSQVKALRSFARAQTTFGIFGEDPEFDQIVRLGREYRDQVNAEDA